VKSVPVLVVHKEGINQKRHNYLIFRHLNSNDILMLTTLVNCGILFGLVFADF